MVDKDTIQMLRDGKAARDERGVTDKRADLVLAVYEAGMTPPLGATDKQLAAMVNDPANAQSDVLAEARNRVAPSAGDGTARVRRGGEAASNQFGTFAVHVASEAQVRFIKRLVGERDLGDVKIPTELESISKTAASALIDRLQARPVKATNGAPAATGTRKATDKQMAFLRRLIAERDYFSLGASDRAKVDALNANPNAIPTAKGASDLIDVLTKTSLAREVSSDGHTFDRKPAQGSDSAELELGMYRKADGTLYRVYPGRESGRLLAKRLILGAEGEKASFEYAGLASRFVVASERMSLEDAKAFGHQFGICCVCGALLTDPTSVDAGIGPVCGSRV